MSTSRKRALVTCSAVHVVHDGLADLTYVLLPLLAQAFGLSLAQVGLLRSAHRAAMAALQMPAGLLAERFGERNLLALGTLVTGLAFLALGHASGFVAVLAALFFAGVGSSVQHPAASALLSRAYPSSGRRAALGTYNFAGDVGKFSFGAIVSLALVAGIGWQAPVFAFGALALLAAAAVLWLVANASPPQAARRSTAAGAGGAGWGIRDRRGFTLLCLVEVLDASTRAGFLTFVAFLFLSRGLDAAWAAAAVPLVLVGGMAGKLGCGLLAERLGVVRMIAVTELLTAAGIFAVLLLPPLAAFFVLPLLGVVLQGTSSVLYASVGEFVEPERLPRSFGLFYTVGSACGIAAPLALGVLGDRHGVAASIAAIGALVLLTLPLAALLRSRYAAARLSSAAE